MPWPSRVSVRDWLVWLDTVMITGPAPTLLGEMVTRALVMTPVSCSVSGGRGLLAKSFPPPQPASAKITTSADAVTLRMRGNLTEPDRGPACDEAIDLALDLTAD